MSEKPQSFDNHIRLSPLYHFFVTPALLINFGWSVYQLIIAPSAGAAIGTLTAVALICLGLSARLFALTVQNRVIRLEMRLRLRDALPVDLQPRIPELEVGQLVALRFASDEELAALAAQVIRDRITDKKAIKQMIKRWNPDHLRA